MGDKDSRRIALEAEMNGPAFWNDQEKAKGTIHELKALNAVLKPFEELGRQGDDLEALLELADEAIAVSTQYSFELGLAWATNSQGWALAENGREEGLGTLIHGLAATRATGANLNNTFTLALLAEIYLRHNRIDEGLAAIEDALTLAVTGGERFWRAELLRLKGELLLGQPDPSVHAAEE